MFDHVNKIEAVMATIMLFGAMVFSTQTARYLMSGNQGLIDTGIVALVALLMGFLAYVLLADTNDDGSGDLSIPA